MTDKTPQDNKKAADDLSIRLLQSIAIQATQMQPFVNQIDREDREALRMIDEDLSSLLDWLQENGQTTEVFYISSERIEERNN